MLSSLSRGYASEGLGLSIQPSALSETEPSTENLLRGIYAYGYESPSAVQSRAIVQICKGRDTIAQAQSGTGKTATFSISILQVIDTAVRETQGEGFKYVILQIVRVYAKTTVKLLSSRLPASSQPRYSPSLWLLETT